MESVEGSVIVPALLFLLKMRELEAIGASLAALIPPVGLLGAIEYYRNGYIKVRYAAMISLGLFIGAYFGAQISLLLSVLVLRRIYATFLIVVAARMMWAWNLRLAHVSSSGQGRYFACASALMVSSIAFRLQ